MDKHTLTRDRFDLDDDLTNLAQSNGSAERKSESAEAESATKEEGETPGDDADMNEEEEADIEEDSEDVCVYDSVSLPQF